MRFERLITVLRTATRILTEVIPLIAHAVIEALQRLKQKS